MTIKKKGEITMNRKKEKLNEVKAILNEIKYKNTKINILIDDEDIEINY